MKPLWIAVFLMLVMVVLGAGVAISVRSLRISQPISFSHRLHVEDLGSDCTDCHLYAETGVRATIPNIEVCSDCHLEAQTESAEEAKLVQLIEAEELIPWQKVYRVPDHVYFSHRRHTAAGGIDCEVCHGNVRDREIPVVRQEIRISMDFCMECHDESDTSNDCLLCHR